MNSLILDGICDLGDKLDHYGVNPKDPKYNARTVVWCRLAMPIHVALTLIRTVCVQSVRGTAFLLIGAVCLDKSSIKEGAVEMGSMLIQGVALPLLAFFTCLSPDLGYKCIKGGEFLFNQEDRSFRPIPLSSHQHLRVVRKRSTQAIWGLAGMVNAFVSGMTLGIEHLISGNVYKGMEDTVKYGTFIFKAPFNCFSNLSYALVANRLQ